MKKQAIIITAYKNPSHLIDLVNVLKKRFIIFIHVDKKSKEIDEEIISKLESLSDNIIIQKKYKINWGGINHLFCILSLLNIAISNPEISYFHIISGEDYPLMNVDELYKTFTNEKRIFMSCESLNNLSQSFKERYTLFHFPDAFNYKSSNINEQRCMVYFTKLVNKLFKRNEILYKYHPMEVYKGLVYVSLPRDAVEYVVEYCKLNKGFINRLKTVLIPEEFFFQTILMNSDFKNRVVNEDLRFCIWEMKNGNYPAIIDLDDFDNIIKSSSIFARKFSFGISDSLKYKINEYYKIKP